MIHSPRAGSATSVCAVRVATADAAMPSVSAAAHRAVHRSSDGGGVLRSVTTGSSSMLFSFSTDRGR
ncbi:hypothetical protein ABFC64_16860 [Microbacterium rhizosphaerae]|uniref:hypothetical protein n=1 Tax=Microbacterium rhizosphaerae TaxID=1678237 RepID=UPI0032181F56